VGVPDLPHIQRVGRGKMVHTLGTEQGKVLAMEERPEESSPITSRQSHKTGIYNHLPTGAGCMRERIPEANRYLRLRAYLLKHG